MKKVIALTRNSSAIIHSTRLTMYWITVGSVVVVPPGPGAGGRRGREAVIRLFQGRESDVPRRVELVHHAVDVLGREVDLVVPQPRDDVGALGHLLVDVGPGLRPLGGVAELAGRVHRLVELRIVDLRVV